MTQTLLDRPVEQPKMRRIIIETDGNNIKLVEADVAGNLELVAILQTVLRHILVPKDKKQLK